MMTSQTPSEHQRLSRRIDLGWLIPRELEAADLDAVVAARDCMSAHLGQVFPEFDWHMPLVRRTEALRQGSIEPTRLLAEGVEERDIRHWDFAFVLTGDDLQTYYKPFALAVPSRTIGVAVISLARLGFEEEGQDRPARRLCSLGMHLFGDLNGLPHCTDPARYMFAPGHRDNLENMVGFSEKELGQLDAELQDVADLRLEERPAAAKSGSWAFYLKGIWIGRGDILSAVVQAKPWEFPFRLSRLTTAALSALLVLLMTAEVWDLGMNQAPLFVGILSGGSLIFTTLFVLKRQNLLLHRRRRLTEQIVFTNLATVLIVLLGMTTTYVLMFGLVAVIGLTIFPHRLVEQWVASLPQAITWPDYILLAGFVASLGILIGALGASFEGNQYFRHITYVDEEI
ncbi:MAG: hypothetical protein R2940_09690 [Syntrophotaleaceae bacterium]